MELAIEFLTENATEKEDVVKISYNILRKLHILHSSLDDSIQEIVSLVDQKAQLKLDLMEFRKRYSIESIFTKTRNNGDTGEFHKIRRCLETDLR
jgi:hypothetical protein